MTRIIGVVSGKGGVGKTTLVSNLGASLAKDGFNVAILDANLTGANLGLHYGLISYPISVHDVMKKNAALSDAVYKHPSGVDVVPASLSFEDILDTPPVNIGQEIKTTFADKDYVLIDAATGLDRETLNAIDMCDEFILVTHPELPTISDALRTKSIINKYEKKITGIVLNRVTKKDELKKDYIASFFKLPVLGVVPEDSSIRRSIEMKTPIVLHNPKHKVSLEMNRIASKISGKDTKIENITVWDQIFTTIFGKKKTK